MRRNSKGVARNHSESGIVHLFVPLLVILVLVIGGFFAYQQGLLDNLLKSPTPSSTPPPPEVTTKEGDPTANWETITDDANNYSFRIPDGWKSYPGRKGTDRFIQRIEPFKVVVHAETKELQTQMIIEKCKEPNCKIDVNMTPGSNPPPQSTKSLTLGGYPATKEIYITNDAPWESRESYRVIVNIDTDSIYIINWQDFTDTFDQILSTFQFTQ